MKRRRFLAAAGAGLAAAQALAAPAIAQERPEVRWRLASSFPKSLDTIFWAGERFAERVGEITDGRFRIRVFAAGEIVGGLDVFDAVSSGAVEAGQTPYYYNVGKDPAFAFGTTLPFGMTTRVNDSWLLQGGGNELINTFIARYGVIGFPAGNTGAQMGGWFRREIRSLEDLKGLKMRATGLGGRILASLGVVPQQIAAGDVYPALERGTIDAVEFIGPHDDEKLGLQRIAPFYYYPGWWEGSASLHACFNLKAWEALPKSYQAALQVAAAEAHLQSLARYDAFNAAALRRLVASGAQLRAFPRDVLDAAFDASFKLYDQFTAESPGWAEIYPHWRKFREEAFLWQRVAEHPFESYVYGRQARG